MDLQEQSSITPRLLKKEHLPTRIYERTFFGTTELPTNINS